MGLIMHHCLEVHYAFKLLRAHHAVWSACLQVHTSVTNIHNLGWWKSNYYISRFYIKKGHYLNERQSHIGGTFSLLS